ncbi:hypothetical protein AAVH_12149 [Aphelenchoides avenae]|nr:hypothetical protein AAVH_12149 [Aphelenchus avenae]
MLDFGFKSAFFGLQYGGCEYVCSGEPCKNCTPGTECDVAPYERCELDAVLGTANCSKTEILLEYYLRWKLRADERPDEYDVVFPLECTELDFCDNITHPWQQQLKLHIGLRAPQKATGEWVVVASVGRKDAKAVDRLGDLGFDKQILLADLPTGTLYADFPSVSLLMTKWNWEQKWDAAFLGVCVKVFEPTVPKG